MDNNFACDDMNDVKSDDVEVKQRRVVGPCRWPFNAAQIEILERAYKEASHIDTERAVELSSFLGLPYHKIKKWFYNRRAKSRRLDTENTSDSSEGMEGGGIPRQNSSRVSACLPLKRLRNDIGLSPYAPFQKLQNLPSVPVFQKQIAKQTIKTQQTTTFMNPHLLKGLQQTIQAQQTTNPHLMEELQQRIPTQQTIPDLQQTIPQQTIHGQQQTMVGVKQQTITQQIHSQPLCWPPVYHASPSFDVPSMSMVLVDYLKENPHLLTPVQPPAQPAKRRRVECEVNVPKCEDSILDKVKRWFMTMDAPGTHTLADDKNEGPSAETQTASNVSTPSRSAAEHVEDVSSIRGSTLRSEEHSHTNSDSVPDDVSIMFKSYSSHSHSDFAEDRNLDTRSESVESGVLRVSDADSNPYSEARSESSDIGRRCFGMAAKGNDTSATDSGSKGFERKSSGYNLQKLVILP